MRCFAITFCLFLICLVCNSQDLYIIKESSIDFLSDAPLEMIKAESNDLNGILKISDRTFAFRSPMISYQGFNSSLQKTHFNENYMESEKYPYTIFEGKIIEEIDFKTPGVYNVRGKGKFTCHGVAQERIIKCKLKIGVDKIEVSTFFTVLLEDHNIKIPSIVNQKIAEEIVVNIQILLVQKK